MEDTDSLESTWEHMLWVTSGLGLIGLTLARAVQEAAATSPYYSGWAALALSGLLGYVFSDLVSGIYHWLVDNYGDSRTPILGSTINATEGHHRLPWTISKRQLANNIHPLARVATFVAPPALFLPKMAELAGLHGFLSAFMAFGLFSQHFHAWAHTKKEELPPLVVALQDAGLLLPRKMHAAHHRAPYSTNYCIVSGLWNPFLDRSKAFLCLERLIYRAFGVRPRSWNDAGAGATAGERVQQ